jgi:hypothetical protein
VVFFDRERVFSGVNTVLLEPFCVHIETAGRLAHDFHVELLSPFSQQPVDKDFDGVGVGCMLDDADHAGTVACRHAFFQLGKFLNRQVGGDKTLECVKADAESDREFIFCQRVGELAPVSTDKEILLDEFSKVTLSLMSQRKDQMDWPDPGVLGSRNPTLPFHLGFRKSSSDRSSSGFATLELYQKPPVPASAMKE